MSSSNYWLAYGLAEKGHKIHVVTNAGEVEPAYRMSMAGDDAAWCQPHFHSGGSIATHSTEPFSRRALDHIPLSNPFVSKLAALTADVVRAHACEVILAYYYEPYGVAASMAAQWTGRPMFVRHAGSDLDRMYRAQSLATTYREMLRSAAGVVTRRALMERFLYMGIDARRLHADPSYFVPEAVFHPRAEPLDVLPLALRRNWSAPDDRGVEGRPAIGIYGKIGETKGTFDLLASLDRLCEEGLDFNLLAMIGEQQADRLSNAITPRLAQRTLVVPFLPNWRVPSFIRACTAVCFLEREFPVAIHGPVIPREVLACGTCLVLSGEIASKQAYRDKLAHRDNVVLVQDPRNHDELTAELRRIVENPDQARAIGRRGADLSAEMERFADFVAGWEQLLVHAVRDTAAPGVGEAPLAVDLIAPAVAGVVRRLAPSMVKPLSDEEASKDPIRVAIQFCDVVWSNAGKLAAGDDAAKLRDVIRCQKARLLDHHTLGAPWKPDFAAADRLQRNAVTLANVARLRPVRSNYVRIEHFDWNVIPMFDGTAVDGDGLESLQAESVEVLFCRAPNEIVQELRIDSTTLELVAACDGTRTTMQIAEEFCRRYGDPSIDRVLRSLLPALERLYRADVLVFGEAMADGGWIDGLQGVTVTPIYGIEDAQPRALAIARADATAA